VAILSNQPKRVIARTTSEDSTILCFGIAGLEKREDGFIISSSNGSNHSTNNLDTSLNSPRHYQKTKSKPQTDTNFHQTHAQSPLINTSCDFIKQKEAPKPLPYINAEYPVLFAGCQNKSLIAYSLRLPNYTEATEDSQIQGNEIELLYPSGRIRLTDVIIHITVHWTDKNKRCLVFVGLANSTVLMFQKTVGKASDNNSTPDEPGPIFDLTQYYLINLNANHNPTSNMNLSNFSSNFNFSNTLASIKSPRNNSSSGSSTQIGSTISIGRYFWVSVKNTVYVIDTFIHGGEGRNYAQSFEDLIPPRVVTCFSAHPRKDACIKNFTKDQAASSSTPNVWISIKLDSTIRLFSS